jgi:flagellar motor switch protein FliN/FliY
MSNKDYLSQEEIDALLKRTAEEDFPSGEAGSAVSSDIYDYLNALEQDALGEIGNITFGSAATALSTLLGKKVDITTPKVSAILRKDLIKEFPKPHVAVHVNYVEGFKGINLLVIKTNDAKVIADLMLGGTGQVPQEAELTEIHISAVQEAMNQMMGSSATSMSTIFNRFVNISPPGIDIMDLPQGEGMENLPVDSVFIKVSFRLTIGDLIDSTIMQLLPVDFAKEMVHSLISGSVDEPAATAEATAPVREETKPQSDPMVQSAPEQPATEQPAYPQQPYGQPFMQPPMQPQPGYMHNPYQTPYQQPVQPPVNPAVQGIGRDLNVQPVQYSNLNPMDPTGVGNTNLDLLLDIPLRVTVELGRTSKMIKDILELSQGSIIELDKLAGEPVDILVNNKLIAKGEVVVIDENFGVRVTDIISQRDRIIKLQ